MAAATPPDASLPALDSLQPCFDWSTSGARPAEQWKVGTEYERWAIGPDGQPLPYDGPVSIRALLDGFASRGWQPYLESGRPIALDRDGASISLEPAGQFELSGKAVRTIGQMIAERDAHLAQVREVAGPLGVRFAFVGANPLTTYNDVPKMPKGRYGVMRAWMPRVGSLGLQMMHLTCTVQANIDFGSPQEGMEMMRLGHLLSPVFIALFANSPWIEGKDTGKASWRAHIWTDVDQRRCDVRRFAFDPKATMADYTEWLIDMPMYFVDEVRPDGSHGFAAMDGKYTFRDFFERGWNGRRPTLADWELHASTAFPDIRLKRWLEVRQADCVPPDALPALPALVKGLFYDATARREALALLADGDTQLDRDALRAAACQDALNARVGDVDLRVWANSALDIAVRGLERQIAAGSEDASAVQALAPLQAIACGDAEPFYARIRRVMQAGGGLLDLAEPT